MSLMIATCSGCSLAWIWGHGRSVSYSMNGRTREWMNGWMSEWMDAVEMKPLMIAICFGCSFSHSLASVWGCGIIHVCKGNKLHTYHKYEGASEWAGDRWNTFFPGPAYHGSTQFCAHRFLFSLRQLSQTVLVGASGAATLSSWSSQMVQSFLHLCSSSISARTLKPWRYTRKRVTK